MNRLTKLIKLDFRSEAPIYIQIMEQVEQLIASGDLQVGDQLPTVRELAADLKINWNTVARAYRLLDEANLISTQRGRGTFVWEQPDEGTLQKIRHESLEAMTRHFLSDAARHGFTPQEISNCFQSYLHNWEAGAVPQED